MYFTKNNFGNINLIFNTNYDIDVILNALDMLYKTYYNDVTNLTEYEFKIKYSYRWDCPFCSDIYLKDEWSSYPGEYIKNAKMHLNCCYESIIMSYKKLKEDNDEIHKE